VDAKVVQDHHGDAATRAGAGHGPAQLVAERHGAAAVGQRPVQISLAPVHQPKAVLLEVLAGRLHQPLAGPAGARPHSGQGRVQGDLDLVLQVQVRVAQQLQQARQILREQVIGQGRVGDQVHSGWRQQ
jgi:hypothetical protein